MYNFNHERLQITVQAVTMARSAYEESMKYANKRETFGKKLIEHPVKILYIYIYYILYN